MMLLTAESFISMNKFWTITFSYFLNNHTSQEIVTLCSSSTEISSLLHAGGKGGSTGRIQVNLAMSKWSFC